MQRSEVVSEIERLIASTKPERAGAVGPEARLQTDIGLSSVEIVELVLDAEDAFDVTIPDDDTGELMDATVDELAGLILEIRSRP